MTSPQRPLECLTKIMRLQGSMFADDQNALLGIANKANYADFLDIVEAVLQENGSQ